jgi:hypothetical protein
LSFQGSTLNRYDIKTKKAASILMMMMMMMMKIIAIPDNL